MEELSRNKRIAIFSLIVLSLTIVGLFLTGNLSFSGLKSDVLNQACTEKGQKNNLPQYTAFLTKRDQAQRALDLASGEIVVLNKKIVEHKNTIEKKQAQIAEKNSKIDEITAYIEKSCKRPQGVKAIELCQKKKQQKRDLSQDVQILNNSIAIVKNTINQLSQKIQINQKTISQQIQQIARFNLFIKQYEACDRQLKTKPTLTSPSMSGEAMISGETLVSGEVTIIGKTLISGEVIIPSEFCVSGEVRVPLYRLTVNQAFPAKAEIDGIDFDLAFGNPDTIKFTDFYITEENNSQLLYKCSFLGDNQSQMRCLPIVKSVVNSETKNYILSAKITSMTALGSLKVYGANITYNGSKVDSINQTTMAKINYAPKPIKTEIQYVSQFGKFGRENGQFWSPEGITTDKSQNIYISDELDGSIQKFDSQGKFLMKFASLGNIDEKITNPQGVAVDASGNIYINEAYRIQKFDSQGKFLMKFGTQGSGDGEVRDVEDIAIDLSGNIYIADSWNHRIQKFDSQGKFLMKFGTQGSGDGQLNHPKNLTLDTSGNIYVSDSLNHRIQKFDSQGKFLMKFGTYGENDAQFQSPRGILVDTDKNIYVSDSENNRIQKFDSQGKFLMQFGYGSKLTVDGTVRRPQGIVADSFGDIYIVDSGNNRIQKFAQVTVCEKPSITVLAPNGGETFVLGTPIKIPYEGKGISNTHAFLVPANSPGNGIGSLGVIGSGANSSGTYEWGGKWLLTSSVDGKMIDVLPGDYKIYMVGDVAGESGKIVSDMSDSSFKIVSGIICPQFMPPLGGFCPNGVEIPGGTDINGCPLPPICKPKEENITTCLDNPNNYWDQQTNKCYPGFSPSIIQQSCNDPDRGQNINQFAHTSGFRAFSSSIDPSRDLRIRTGGTDSCLSNTQIREHYCGENGFIKFIDLSCPNGCSDGACIKESLCPQFMPPSGGFCPNGVEIPGGTDINGCPLPPTCKPDTISPIITSLTIPTTSSTTRVPLTLVANETPFSYLMIDALTPKDGTMGAMPLPPLSTDTRWISGMPTIYNFSGTGARTFFVWIKDVAENVSYPQIANVNIVVCPQFMPPLGGWCNGGETIPGGIDSNGCSLPPKCKSRILIGNATSMNEISQKGYGSSASFSVSY